MSIYFITKPEHYQSRTFTMLNLIYIIDYLIDQVLLNIFRKNLYSHMKEHLIRLKY